MGFNNKKAVLAQVLTVCLFSSMVSSNVGMVSAENQTNVNIDSENVCVTAQESEDNTYTTTIIDNQDVQNTEIITQTSIISKFDFEYELQRMLDTYKNMQEAQKKQAKEDTLNFLEELAESEDYSIEEKRQLGKTAISNAVFNDVLQPLEALTAKQDLEYKLNKQSDVENLEYTIENILNSTVSIETKQTFCINALDLSLLSGSITEDEYTQKVQDVQDTLDAQQQAEEERLAQEEAERLAKEEQAKAEAEAEAKKQAEELAKAQAEEQAKQQAEAEAKANAQTQTDVQPTQSIQDASQQTSQVGFNGSISYTEKDFLALCNVVQHEVGNCSTLSKQMVASVIINRVLSNIFPSNIYDVVNQKNQFTGMSAFIDRTDYATDDTKYWCQYVLDNGIDYSNGAIFYYAPQWCGYMSYFENMTLVAEHDGQRYFK